MDDKGRTHFRQAFREAFEGDPAKSGIYKDLQRYRQRRHRVLPAAVLRRDRHALRLPADGCRVRHARRCAGRHRRLLADTRSRYNLLQGDKARPLLPPDQLFLGRSLLHGCQIVWPRGFLGQIRDAGG
jgi:transcription-repair coupling factor (superfamily II helicase)